MTSAAAMSNDFIVQGLPGGGGLVSVLVAAYNHERYVEEAIRSVISQTYPNIELIVIDDGSQDGTWQKVCALEKTCDKRFARVVFKTQPNQGRCETFNRLLAEARGDYVFFLASDDLVKNQAIAREVSFLQSNPDYVLVVGDNEFIDADSVRVGWNAGMMPVPLGEASAQTFKDAMQQWHPGVDFASEEFGTYRTLLQFNYIPNGYLIRAAVLREMKPFTSVAPLEDLYLHLQLSKTGRYRYLDEIFLSYRGHPGNVSKQRRQMIEMTNETFAYERWLLARPEYEELRDVFARERSFWSRLMASVRRRYHMWRRKRVSCHG